MQRVLTSPLGEGIGSPSAPRRAAFGPGETTTMKLDRPQSVADGANEVVISDKLPTDSPTTRHGAPRGSTSISDPGGQSPFDHGPGGIGYNAGTVRTWKTSEAELRRAGQEQNRGSSPAV